MFAGYQNNMQQRFKKWGRRILIGTNIIIIFCYLLVCLVPFLNAGTFWPVAMLGLVFPVLLIGNLLFLILWLIKRSRWAFLCLASLLLSWQQLSVLFAFHFGANEFRVEKSPNTLRVLSWNVIRWDEHNRKARGGTSYRPQMINLISRQNADVLCLQEFFEPRTSRYFRKNIDTLRSLGYGYHYFFPSSITVNGEYRYGTIILSKFPIVDSAKLSFGNTPHSEGMIYADINVNGDTCRVFSVHLESARMGKRSYLGGATQGSTAGKAKNAVQSLKRAYAYRSSQAGTVRQQIDASPYPVILCGNLGDIPNSYVYFKVRGHLWDAFLKKGKGLGRTFRFISPTLRIDYVLADPKFRVEQYTSPAVIYSDHYPLVVDLSLR